MAEKRQHRKESADDMGGSDIANALIMSANLSMQYQIITFKYQSAQTDEAKALAMEELERFQRTLDDRRHKNEKPGTSLHSLQGDECEEEEGDDDVNIQSFSMFE